MKPLICAFALACLSACGGGDPDGDCTTNPQNVTVREQPQWRERCPAPAP